MVATTEVELYNLAISLAGGKATVTSISEASREAETCLLWYGEVRNRILNAAPWESTKASARLDLDVERDSAVDWEDSDPHPGWTFSYELPTDYMRPRYLSTFERFDIGVDSAGAKRLYTDREDPILVYSRVQDTITTWDHSLKMAIIHALAAYISMPLAAKIQRTSLLLEQANEMITEARIVAANALEHQHESLPEWITARGYGGYAPGVRYVYPNGPLLSLTAAPVT